MNRKQKIIVSITGIVLVSLILIGLTYAYFLTKITGNTNDKSISVSTANLVLEYGENTNVVQGINNAEPGYSVEKIFTATNKGNSSVTYGAALESIVNELSRQQDLVYTLTCTSYKKEGFKLSSDGTITGTVDGTCNGVTTEKQFPSTSTLSIMTTNTIDTTHTHAYKLTITYKEMGVDQSEDMNKTFSAKVNIVDLAKLTVDNPYKNDTGTLKKAIIDNAMLGLNGTTYQETSKTKPAAETSSFTYSKGTNPTTFNKSMPATNYYISFADDYTVDKSTGKLTLVNPTVETTKYTTDMASSLLGKYTVWSTSIPTEASLKNLSEIYKISTNLSDVTTVIRYAIIDEKIIQTSTEKELSITADDYGTSYYYRGGIENNYVNFAEMCWRIVRIEGDGSVKLILEDYNTTCNSSTYTGNWSDGNVYVFGYDSNNKTDFLNYSGGLADALKTFQTTKMYNYLDKLKIESWCYDDNIVSTDSNSQYYGAYKRIITDKLPSLVCSGTKLSKYKDETDMYVGTLTVDEVAFAGGANDTKNYTNYLMNNFSNENSKNWWLLSPKVFNNIPSTGTIFAINIFLGGINNYTVAGSLNMRPSIVLKSNTKISNGNGTIENPYIIE